MTVVSDTTPFISLSAVGKLELLPQLYGDVTIPEADVKELDAGGPIVVPNVRKLSWVNIVPDIRDEHEKFLYNLDEGERQVIIHGLAVKAELVLIDEILARKIASHLGLNIKGTLGVLVEAKRKGYIESFTELAVRLKEQGIFFSARMINEISRLLNEGRV